MSATSAPQPRALLSVYDKTGIVEFATSLSQHGFQLVSTGGTARTLRAAGLEVIGVSDVTGHPEIFDGRVKSLHPAIHGPLLARLESEVDQKGLAELGYPPIQIVACNLYPFSAAAAQQPPLQDPELLEMIDIGGPTMVRASAKNHRNVIIACNPSRYDEIISALNNSTDAQSIGMDLRQSLALDAYEHTAAYDSAIADELHARWIGRPELSDVTSEQTARLPSTLLASAVKTHSLRYGENSHQAAALYTDPRELGNHSTLVTAHVEGEKDMSYNNYSDADATLRLCRALSTDEWPDTPHVCVIVKHNNPCGAALGKTQKEAFEEALASDPESAFGSIICFNEPLEVETAKAMEPLFIEVLMAPAYNEDAKSIAMQKKNRRILTIESPGNRLASLERILVRKPIEGGWLVQTEEAPVIDWEKAKVVTKKSPSEAEIASMKFAVRICEQVKSNAIVMVQGTATVGIGPGQTSRVEAVRIAARRAGERAKGCVLASDAFFPFKDGLEQAADAGASSIVQPGGSIRDQEVIDAADKRGISMLFTGHRLFRH
ncbi:MAG: bifunctional phosphoribosylaminoimidazolecarboxamide formyltransferase/IMP cyclohydrolase [Euryarchaeota archaeon]|jgi:phosphoribosylaminoimidazolecarboxamide formyltransferase/IMP cyclohydrolase|nr:bifunctional phosphoribosylaminoimidazolecarboxamide formyltransferase/IMP cyclohydrolase [Euryarchaeota archaeon]MBT5594171.1 bifunctional phosphoribosylaminoimidazolecarboxamide formyltransferase/IMP cyclohydrolase [Euryarchaeota archaeon]MBT5844121.1 bifunctional phosphoribosylaminoimidazolecarboxamide formyltransferase/IMP cyclohydrolase [Euryarchaeota archaeon]MBT6641040.1 bifunctional phosphoribosylaminoimidazolecarboxamide formyltransferase/IMP cyclohydrolase [Euryarchaeota archaeon]M